MNKKAVVYVRVSTDDQAEHGYSLQSQIESCNQYAEKQSLDVVDTISDDCSGAKLERPGLDVLRDKIENHEINTVLIYMDDRLSRNLAHSLLLREEWRKRGIDIHTVVRGKFEDTAEGRLTGNIQAVIAEYEREKIRERTRRCRLAKARNGKIPMTGTPPFGYLKVGKGRDSKYVINDEDSHIVKNIFDWYIDGDGNNGPLSLRAIAKKLHTMNIPTPNHKCRRAKVWQPGAIRGILRNEIYIGKAYYGKLRTINDKRVKQPREKWIEIDVPELAIIERDQFNAVQKRAERNSEKSRRNRRRQYLLSGHFRCGNCGEVMTGSTRASKTRDIQYYRCTKAYRANQENECSHKWKGFRVDKIDSLVWDWIVDLLSDEERFKTGLTAMIEKHDLELVPTRERIGTLTSLIDENNRRINNLVSELANHDDPVIINALRTEMKSLSKTKRSLEQEREKFEDRIHECELSATTKDLIQDMTCQIRGLLPNATYQDKRRIMDILDVRVILSSEDKEEILSISCSIPTTERMIVLRSS